MAMKNKKNGLIAETAFPLISCICLIAKVK